MTGHVVYKGLILDFGGVVTTDFYGALAAFSERAGLDPGAFTLAARTYQRDPAFRRPTSDEGAFPGDARKVTVIIGTTGGGVDLLAKAGGRMCSHSWNDAELAVHRGEVHHRYRWR